MRFLLPALFLISFGVNAQTDWPRYNEVYQVATHNSYWVKRAKHELYASGTQERLLDQLHLDHVRALEIDIHKIKDKPGQWAVYHTGKTANVFCETLVDFLRQMQQFQYSLPQHEVVTVVLELKEITARNFDDRHTPAQLDSLLEKYLGDNLFRPRDMLARCPGKSTLCECITSSASIWPTTRELRSKFIFLVLGNLHFGPFGHGAEGWATYANTPNPSAFPMSSDFSRFAKRRHGWKEYIPEDILARAYNASIFQQVENTNDVVHLTDVSKFIASGGIVRGGSSFTVKEQFKRIKAGFHLLQTDYPWIQLNDRGYDRPFRPVDSTRFKDESVFIEPGNRLFISGEKESLWTITSRDSVDFWETLPSATRLSPNKDFPNPLHAGGKGCLVAKGLNDSDFISICRKINLLQNAVITIHGSSAGKGFNKKFTTTNRMDGIIGDYIAMRIEQHPCIGSSSIMLFSSSEMQRMPDGSLMPLWNLLDQKEFHDLLFRQGLQSDQGAILFVGTRRNNKFITAQEFGRK